MSENIKIIVTLTIKQCEHNNDYGTSTVGKGASLTKYKKLLTPTSIPQFLSYFRGNSDFRGNFSLKFLSFFPKNFPPAIKGNSSAQRRVF
ncbi:hypothetical protein CEXT_1691 [Caerostris extrusa]|uniref:Uncharacterized protein n=1 Tax=Caerostris extrusa TaxID=172846 RepID=A0AAV4X460_CAEEX|nr:hypothetical protein CEXT_1691 [Caerostris extrusa]